MSSPGPDGKFYGPYRGTVINNVDPDFKGRLLVEVPDVGGPEPCLWAEPATPAAGPGMGIYAIPPAGSGVWIVFEQGDPNYPMWIGSMRGSTAEVPPLALTGVPASPNIVLQTTGQNSLVISDNPAIGIMLKMATSMILMNSSGITITNGQAIFNMTGLTVTINGTGLVVT